MRIRPPEEAKDAIDLMTERFQECVSKVDKSLVQVSELMKEVKDLGSKLEALSQEHSSLKKNTSNAVAEVDGKNAQINASLSTSLSSVSKVADSCSQDTTSIKKEIQSVKDSLDKAIQNQNVFAKTGSTSIAEAKADIEDIKTTIINTIAKWEEKDISNKGAHADLKKFVGLLETDLVSAKGTLREFVGSTSNFAKDLANHKESTATQFEQLKQGLTFFIEDKIASLPKPSLTPSITAEDAKLQIQKQVEPASLDARNANLRSSNNEQKITLLEKKVENLNLLLNKLQLSH
jgi:hypothetical protein